MSRTDLTEKQWRQLESHLPSNPHHGYAYVEHRHVINGILWRLRTGAPWGDVLARYEPWQTCYDRFVRWSRDGTWKRLLKIMQTALWVAPGFARIAPSQVRQPHKSLLLPAFTDRRLMPYHGPLRARGRLIFSAPGRV